MKKMPKISIITPNLNRGDTIGDTIESILSQKYPNLEYIIIDGGSTDNSLEVIKNNIDKISYFVSEPDGGLYEAIQKGAKHCTGDIMTWIGSDDMLHRNSLFIVAEIFDKFSEVQWLTGCNTYFDTNGRTVGVNKGKYFNRTDLLSYNYKWIQQESTFWRRSLYEKVGGVNTRLRLAGDFELWVKFSRHTKLYICDSLIGGFRISGGKQLSNDTNAYDREVEEVTKNEWLLYPNDKKKVDMEFWKRRLKARFKTLAKLINLDSLESEMKNQKITFDFKEQCYILR